MIKLLRYVPVVRRMFSPAITGFVLFSCLARAEEKSVWEKATVSSSFDSLPDTSPLDKLINGTFNEIVCTNSSERNQFIMIDQGKALKLSRLFIQNRSFSALNRITF